MCVTWDRHVCSTLPSLGRILMFCQAPYPQKSTHKQQGLFGSHHALPCLSDPRTESGKHISITVPGIAELRKAHLSRKGHRILNEAKRSQEFTSVPLLFFPLQLDQLQFQSLNRNYNAAFNQILRIMSGKVTAVIFPKAGILSIVWYAVLIDIKRSAPRDATEMLQNTKAAECTES